MGVNSTIATVFMTMCVSALALTSLDAVARIARVSLQEFFAKSNDVRAVSTREDRRHEGRWQPLVSQPSSRSTRPVASPLAATLNIWPLLVPPTSSLGGMTMITIAVFCKVTGRKGWMHYVPVAFLLCCTLHLARPVAYRVRRCQSAPTVSWNHPLLAPSCLATSGHPARLCCAARRSLA
jgi:carbon starvation protein